MSIEASGRSGASPEALEPVIQSGSVVAAAEALAGYHKSLSLLEDGVREPIEQMLESVAQRSYRQGFIAGQAHEKVESLEAIIARVEDAIAAEDSEGLYSPELKMRRAIRITIDILQKTEGEE